MPPHPATLAPAGAVLITGASTGIGAAAAASLAAAGYFVFGGVRSAGAGESLVASLGGPTRAAALLLDVTDPASIAAATLTVAAALEDTGGEGGGQKTPPPPRRLAALVNNAGVSLPGPLLAAPAAEVEATLAVNLHGALAVTRAVAPLLGIADAVGVPGLAPVWRRQQQQQAAAGEGARAPRPGKGEGPPPLRPLPALAPPGPPGSTHGRPVILNISSVAGRVAGPFMGAYAASKHGLEGASDTVRREVAPFGVEVVVLELGAVRTPLWAKADALDAARYDGTAWATPLRTFMRLMGEEGRAGHSAAAAGAAVADIVARSGRAPPPPPAEHAGWAASAAASLARAAWAVAIRAPPRVELIARRWLVWAAPLSLPDRVSDWAVSAAFGL